jgi:cell wall-associated NlpC family hydrolase
MSGNTTPTPQPAAAGRAEQVVDAAVKLQTQLENSKYLEGGKTTQALDCSYFVYLALHAVFPEYQYLDSRGIIASDMFDKVDPPGPGDVIYFPPSTDQWWHDKKGATNPGRLFPGHVGIVISGTQWVGMQSSGTGRVVFTDQYFWGTRKSPSFYRYKGLNSADLAHLQARSATP